MQRMMEETGRRRVIQMAYNEEHGIIPTTIMKSVQEIELSTRVADARTPKEVKVAEARAAYGAATGKDPEEVLRQLELDMRDAAAQLDFERAALLRDQLLEIRAQIDGTRGSGSAARNMRAEPV
jgi:excinuclease ABC subunit B